MKIVWSKKAKYTFHNIRNYLEVFWSPLISQKFIKDALHIIDLLKKNPLLGKHNPDLLCREIIISKHITLYYKTEENCIELITFYNTRQKPINIFI